MQVGLRHGLAVRGRIVNLALWPRPEGSLTSVPPPDWRSQSRHLHPRQGAYPVAPVILPYQTSWFTARSDRAVSSSIIIRSTIPELSGWSVPHVDFGVFTWDIHRTASSRVRSGVQSPGCLADPFRTGTTTMFPGARSRVVATDVESSPPAIGIDEVRQAAERLRPWVHRTPVLQSRTLNARCGRHGVAEVRELPARRRVQVPGGDERPVAARTRRSGRRGWSRTRRATTPRPWRWPGNCSAFRCAW